MENSLPYLGRMVISTLIYCFWYAHFPMQQHIISLLLFGDDARCSIQAPKSKHSEEHLKN
jgi:hypothetical protein